MSKSRFWAGIVLTVVLPILLALVSVYIGWLLR
jgi:hypothetical protein